MPLPKVCHETPFQRAMFVSGSLPAALNLPPAYRFVPLVASALTLSYVSPKPLPSADQVLFVFQRAILVARIPPAE